MQITVRTWHSVRDDSEKGYGNRMFLEKIELPTDVVMRIQEWAKEQQLNLLTRKYKKTTLSFEMTQRQEYLASMNQLYQQLQSEGFNSEKERLAISFLFGQHRDNPELIDLGVTAEFLDSLSQQAESA